MSAVCGVDDTVSVVLLSYNRPGYFRRALDSVLQQSYRRLEIILVDNLSESSDEIREVARAHPEIILIANDRNLGFTGGMNLGLERATGEFVLLTEDDLTLAENCVETFVEHFRAHPASGLASGMMLNRNWVHMVFDDAETMSLQRLRGLGLKMKGPPCFVSV